MTVKLSYVMPVQHCKRPAPLRSGRLDSDAVRRTFTALSLYDRVNGRAQTVRLLRRIAGVASFEYLDESDFEPVRRSAVAGVGPDRLARRIRRLELSAIGA